MLKHSRAWLVVMSASLLFFYSFMQLNILNTISGQLMHDFSLTSVQLANISSMYFYANCILVFPAGLLLDRFPTRKLILFAMALSTLGVFGFALATTPLTAAINRFLLGVGGAFCFVSCIRLASRWFPANKLSYVSGWLITMAMLGGLMAQSPMVFLTKLYGWRHAMLLDGGIGLLCLTLIWFFVKDAPYQTAEQETAIPFWNAIRFVLSNTHNWLGGLYTAFMNLPIFLLGALWGIMYLVQVDHLSTTNASFVTTMLFFGTIVGSPMIGWISDQLNCRRILMLICALIATLLVATLLHYHTLTLTMLLVLFFALGFITSAQVLTYPIVTAANPPALTGSANSIISMTLIASGFIFQPFFGWLMELRDKPVIHAHRIFYSPQDFHLAMMVMPAAFLVSFILALALKERKTAVPAQN